MTDSKTNSLGVNRHDGTFLDAEREIRELRALLSPHAGDNEADALMRRASTIADAARALAKAAIDVRDQHTHRLDSLVEELRELRAQLNALLEKERVRDALGRP